MHAEHSGRVRAPFVAVAYALVVMLAGSNLPTPLYPTYQRVFALSPLLVTLVYATYAFTVMPCLLVFGPLSDAVGRRPTLLAALRRSRSWVSAPWRRRQASSKPSGCSPTSSRARALPPSDCSG
jgi:hypothetical protein